MIKISFNHGSFLNCRKGKGGEIEMAEGVGNPVYDSFNEGQPLEEVSDVK